MHRPTEYVSGTALAAGPVADVSGKALAAGPAANLQI